MPESETQATYREITVGTVADFQRIAAESPGLALVKVMDVGDTEPFMMQGENGEVLIYV